MQIIWPLHPRNRNHINEINLPANVQIAEPFSYFEMLLMLEKCATVITDSGGLQKEAYWAKKPCITVRNETEWVETLNGDWNQLFSFESNSLLSKYKTKPASVWMPLYGNGHAADEIAMVIKNRYY